MGRGSKWGMDGRVKKRKKLEEIQDRARRIRESKRILNWKAQRPETEPELHIGDFVMKAEIRKKSKIDMNWTGPWVVIAARSPHVMVVQKPGGGNRQEAHIRRLKRYSEARAGVPADLINASLDEGESWEVKKILSWRKRKNAATIELEIWWKGFSREWSTFETFESMV